MSSSEESKPPSNPPNKPPKKAPQQILSEFWDSFHTKYPGKITSIFPRSLYSSLLPHVESKGVSSSRNAQASYEAAAQECREKVKRIVRECERTNQKFTDPDFDIERDPFNNCLNGLIRDDDSTAGGASQDAQNVSSWEVKNSLDTLANAQVLGPNSTLALDPTAVSRLLDGRFGSGQDRGSAGSGLHAGSSSFGKSARHGVRGSESYSPGSVHRVDWIFDSPQFTMDGYSSSDIKQGANGDCWWLAAVATIAHRRDLMQRVCVARDEECGVYGFVFQRDGEWVSTVVDDNLYLSYSDFEWYGDSYDSSGKKGRQHRERYQAGSEALYFAHCEDKNETWLPLLEKAYAKIHGDYEAISGGWPGEAVEDMTGGVTSTIVTNRVLRKDRLWRELTNTAGEFVFALAAMDMGAGLGQKTGLALGHAYSILQSREEVGEDGKKVRLVQIRNPWGESAAGVGEWMGPWSDGSKEWTPYWMKRLNHTFGDDGVFWMSYEDMFANFMFLHRTRLFDEKWTVVQQWTSANISWVTGYLQMKFVVEISRPGMTVFVLTQLDDRYFHGLEGEYYFQLHFILQKKAIGGGDVDLPSERICHVMPVHDYENRAVSCEVELEPGTYEVIPKITATRHAADPAAWSVEKVVKKYASSNPQKLRQVGAQYDMAHAKGGVSDEDEALEKKKEEERKNREAKKARRKRKERKALAEAAKALEDTARVVSEIAGEDKEPKSKDNLAKSESTEEAKKGDKDRKAGDGKKSPALIVETTTTENQPVTATAPKATNTPLIALPKDEGKIEEAQGQEDTQVDEANTQEQVLMEDQEPSEDSSSEDESLDDSELDMPSWNAVCVFSLRVYAQDSDVSIALVK